MKILIILGHPQKGSFNHAIARTCVQFLKEKKHEVIFHDLCAEKFDPALTYEEIPEDGYIPSNIKMHCDELKNADGIIIVHPNWWGQPPAILKGWIDRVIRPGVAYKFNEGDGGEGVPIGLLKAKSALIFNTSNTSYKREQTVFGDPLERIWKDCILKFCGIENIERRMFETIVTSDKEKREKWLFETKMILDKHF